MPLHATSVDLLIILLKIVQNQNHFVGALDMEIQDTGLQVALASKSASSASSVLMRGGTSQVKNQSWGSGSIGRPTTQGRIFAMNQQDTFATPDVVTFIDLMNQAFQPRLFCDSIQFSTRLDISSVQFGSKNSWFAISFFL